MIAIQPQDYVVIKAQLPGLRAYMQLANPTQAQDSAAIKAVIRVLNAVLRTS